MCSPAVDDDRVVPTSPLHSLHLQHAADYCSWIADSSVAVPAHHLELGHIVDMSRL